MYRIILIIVIALFLFRSIWIYRVGNWNLNLFKNLIYQRVGLLFKWLTLVEFKSSIIKGFRNFFISITIISFIILVLTALIPVLLFNESMGGIFLILHVTIAPFFVIALMFNAVFMGHFQQFDHSDYLTFKKLQSKKEIQDPIRLSHHTWLKIYFWFFLIFSVAAVLSIISAMFPYFGTDGQIAMLNIHRYSTLILLIIALFYADLKLYASPIKLKRVQVNK